MFPIEKQRKDKKKYELKMAKRRNKDDLTKEEVFQERRDK